MAQLRSSQKQLVLHLLILFFIVVACSKDDLPISGSFTDTRDGKSYETIRIGKQTWMVENLAYELSGKEGLAIEDWNTHNNDGWAYYNDDKESFGETYGILYQWEAAKLACPKGWRLPTHDDWVELLQHAEDKGYGLQTSYYDRFTVGKSLASKSVWEASRSIADIGHKPELNNATGFTALPGGYAYGNQPFEGLAETGHWWTSSEVPIAPDQPFDMVYFIRLTYFSEKVFEFTSNKCDAYSVRCIKK